MDTKKIGIAILFLALSAWNFIWLPMGYVSYFFGLLFAGASVAAFIKALKGKKKK